MPILDTVNSRLGVNEKSVHVAHLSWIVSLVPLCFLILGFGVLAAVPKPDWNPDIAITVENIWAQPASILFYPAVLMYALAVFHLIKQVLIKLTTTITVTTDRVAHEGGLIFRFSNEMSRSLIVGADIEQSILGRILNYADVHVKGVGGGRLVIRSVKNPHDMHKKLLIIRDRKPQDQPNQPNEETA